MEKTAYFYKTVGVRKYLSAISGNGVEWSGLEANAAEFPVAAADELGRFLMEREHEEGWEIMEVTRSSRAVTPF